MIVNKKREIRLDQRQRIVAGMLLRQPGITQREICERLSDQGFVNPDTGNPYALGTINGDVKALQEQWRDEAARDIAEWKIRQLAQLDEVYREAWSQKDLRAAMQAIKMQGDIIGTEAPRRSELSGPNGQPIQHEVDVRNLSDDELRALIGD